MEGRPAEPSSIDSSPSEECPGEEDGSLAPPISPSWRCKPLSDAETDKVMHILEACRSRDLGTLMVLATSEHGLVEDEIRRTAWPLLLGYDTKHSMSGEGTDTWRHLPRHPDEDQVSLDVNRSFIYYPSDQSPKQLAHRKKELQDVITEVLRCHPYLCYFQGFHDIVQVLLLVLGVENSPPAVAHLSILRIRDFMLPSLSPALSHLRLLPSILHATDPKLCQHLSQTQPFFALAATLTLYAHDIQEYGDISRLFDFLLAREAVMSVYLFAVIILSRKVELFEIPPDEPEMLHSVLSKLPKPLDLEALISKTMDLYNSHPPPTLPFRAWSQISSYSVLKTTVDPASVTSQTLEDGERLFYKQVAQLRKSERRKEIMETLWKYRRPTGAVGIAVFVGVLSWWLGSYGLGNSKSSTDHVFRTALRRVSEAFRMVTG